MVGADSRQRIKPVTFSSAGGHPMRLEGALHLPAGEGPWPAAVVCHPHPLGGGSMHNGVVVAIARALVDRGVMTLRFNFRGVGSSDGEHDHGQGEQADVAGALDWLLALPEVDPRRVSLVGYSFGAAMGLACAQSDGRVAAVATVGLPAQHVDVDSLRSLAKPKLFIVGERDEVAPADTLRRLVEQLPEPKTLYLVAGADHFWWGTERVVGELVAGFFDGLEAGSGGKQ